MPRINFWKKLIIGPLASLIFLPPVTAQNVSKPKMDQERLARIPMQLKSFVERGAMAGAVTLIARRGRVISVEAIGYRNFESKEPMLVDTIFDTRSVTKPVTAIGIMFLMEEGKLALNDPVEKHLPEFKSAANTRNRITILHLLTHTSGMPLNRPPEIEDITIKRDRTLADVVTILSKQEPDFEPGTQFRYYSGGFAILGRIIEVVSGKPFDQFIKERIFDPLGNERQLLLCPHRKTEPNRIALQAPRRQANPVGRGRGLHQECQIPRTGVWHVFNRPRLSLPLPDDA